ncbi:hypothetical protein TNCV_4549001 [Trichonephila clavipes]|nr:hypothetical protein TNCV_4549001 [Trichonephila clavipes]
MIVEISGTASKSLDSGQPLESNEREDHRIRHCVCGRKSRYSWYHSDTANCSRTAPRQAPCSVYSTDSKPLPFATPVVSGKSSLKDGGGDLLCFLMKADSAFVSSIDMLPWPERSPDLLSIEHVWDIIGRQLQLHPQPVLTDQVLT